MNDIVLAFSGGLDTTFCVPWLQERGYAVHTVFADTGGVDAAERATIEARAAELGVASHVTVDGGPALWSGFVRPFVWAGEGYQGQYPLLVSDRYLIVDEAKMALTRDGVFSHCLPLRRNVKATDGVMDSPACIAIEEAENRLHVQKAVMAALVRQ